jgi:ubiquinone/menaquinone biosynthesis C-methylase UbiE
MSFGYFPDFQNKSKLKDLYLKIFGYPYPSRRNEAVMVFDLLKPKPGEKILDLGCGEGIFTNELAKRKFGLSGMQNKYKLSLSNLDKKLKTKNYKLNITGIDTSTRDLQVARRRAKLMKIQLMESQSPRLSRQKPRRLADTNSKPTLNYLKMDAQNMKFKANTFHKIFSISTIEHIPNDQAVFNECFRVLKPGGQLAISVPGDQNFHLIKHLIRLPNSIKSKLLNTSINKSDTWQQYRSAIDKKFHHHHYYSKKNLAQKLNQAGFKIITIRYNVNLISKIPHFLIHTLKFFEWHKNPKTGYQYNPKVEAILALIFPIFYLFYKLDRHLFSRLPGMAIVISARKP